MSKSSLKNFGGLEEISKIVEKFKSNFLSKNSQYQTWKNAETVFENYSPVSKRMQEYMNSYKKGGGSNYEQGLVILKQKLLRKSIDEALNIIVNSFNEKELIDSPKILNNISSKLLAHPEEKKYVAKANQSYNNKGVEIAELGIACWNLFLKLRSSKSYPLLEQNVSSTPSNRRTQTSSTSSAVSGEDLNNPSEKNVSSPDLSTSPEQTDYNANKLISLSPERKKELLPKYTNFITNRFENNNFSGGTPIGEFTVENIMKINTEESKKVIEKLAILASYVGSINKTDSDMLGKAADLARSATSILTGQSGGPSMS